MDTQLLKYICDIASYGSVTRAAQVNFISPSHLSRQLKKMEEHLGDELFERSIYGMQLTKRGQKFLEQCEPILQHVAELEACFSLNTQPQDAYSFRIAIHHNSMANQAVVNLLNRKIQQHEFLDIIADSFNSVEETLSGMARYQYQLGVIQYSSANREKIMARLKSEGLQEVVVNTVPPHVLVSLTHPLSRLERVSEADLAPYARIYFIEEELSNFNDFTGLNTMNFASIHKRVLIRERGQLFHYLRASTAYYIGTRLCPSCSECRDLAQIRLDNNSTAEIITSAVFPAKARKELRVQQYLDLLIQVGQEV